MIKNKKLYLFDLDGVLFNTKKNMKLSWESVNKKFGLNIKFEKYFSKIGIPFEDIMKTLDIHKCISKIKSHYKLSSIKYEKHIKIYPNVLSTIHLLKKNHINVGVVTSKDHVRTNRLLKKYDLKFLVVQCPIKELRGKPEPDTIIKAIKKTKFKKKNTLYVGDTNNDLIAAKKAGIKFIYANYGYGKIQSKAYKVIKKFSDLLKIN
jgi:HAD superfamily hydrolase (TIGR01662 family)